MAKPWDIPRYVMLRLMIVTAIAWFLTFIFAVSYSNSQIAIWVSNGELHIYTDSLCIEGVHELSPGLLICAPHSRTLASFPGTRGVAFNIQTWWAIWLEFVIWMILCARHRIRAHERKARETEGRCLACGYDLKGVESAVCPECGLASAALARGDDNGDPGQGQSAAQNLRAE